MTKEEQIEHMESRGELDPNCKGCERLYDNPNDFGPPHKASARCESGKHAHCTCDVCF